MRWDAGSRSAAWTAWMIPDVTAGEVRDVKIVEREPDDEVEVAFARDEEVEQLAGLVGLGAVAREELDVDDDDDDPVEGDGEDVEARAVDALHAHGVGLGHALAEALPGPDPDGDAQHDEERHPDVEEEPADDVGVDGLVVAREVVRDLVASGTVVHAVGGQVLERVGPAHAQVRVAGPVVRDHEQQREHERHEPRAEVEEARVALEVGEGVGEAHEQVGRHAEEPALGGQERELEEPREGGARGASALRRAAAALDVGAAAERHAVEEDAAHELLRQ
ncbi:unnamed protein product [Phytophthora fragariaefolia]|uniref:Unnamed protein product n=1 Tax=Phytophthora fragariaefolia TaxID=1490495 RepID=A0A9W6WTB0_9STRA|nr:unnamed protein product [Phytophthora fragariaefolia]